MDVYYLVLHQQHTPSILTGKLKVTSLAVTHFTLEPYKT